MKGVIPRIEPMPDQDGASGFLLTHPLSVRFELELKALVAKEDLFWSAKPAGWWIPERHRAAVHGLTKDWFGYVQVVSPEGVVEHDFLREVHPS